jgi:hypothetical protein
VTEGLVPRDEPWVANHEKFFGTQAGNMEPIPRAVAMPNCDIDIFPRKVDARSRSGYSQIDICIRVAETAQTRHQPLCGKIWRCGHRQHARMLMLQETFGAGG